jgi:hypothetical protein
MAYELDVEHQGRVRRDAGRPAREKQASSGGTNSGYFDPAGMK